MRNNDETSKRLNSIESVLEVRICPEMWGRIRWVAYKRNSSYSWVVRYALFRLVKRIDTKKCISHIGNPRFQAAIEGGVNRRAWARRAGAAKVGPGGKHRHRLCLYGEDEQAIRYTAAYYGCTMTHLIRVALELHFERLYASMVRGYSSGSARVSTFGQAAWFWLGIKVFSDVEFHSITLETRMLCFRRYNRREYWRS